MGTQLELELELELELNINININIGIGIGIGIVRSLDGGYVICFSFATLALMEIGFLPRLAADSLSCLAAVECGGLSSGGLESVEVRRISVLGGVVSIRHRAGSS